MWVGGCKRIYERESITQIELERESLSERKSEENNLSKRENGFERVFLEIRMKKNMLKKSQFYRQNEKEWSLHFEDVRDENATRVSNPSRH